MDAESFACGLCKILLEQGLFLPDTRPHVLILDAARQYFPAVREAIRAEAQKEVEPGRVTPIPVRLPDRK